MNALIIDDEIDICFLLSNIVRNKKIEVSVVNTLAAATLSLKEKVPELIFLDNHLPDGLGLDYIKQIKKKYPRTKIVMITAFDNFTEKVNALFNGADRFIPKPFSKALISSTIDSLMLL